MVNKYCDHDYLDKKEDCPIDDNIYIPEFNPERWSCWASITFKDDGNEDFKFETNIGRDYPNNGYILEDIMILQKYFQRVFCARVNYVMSTDFDNNQVNVEFFVTHLPLPDPDEPTDPGDTENPDETDPSPDIPETPDGDVAGTTPPTVEDGEQVL